MRRYWREQQPARMFRGAELTRLMTGVVMLAVLYMLIVRAGDADTWRWLANGGGKPTAPAKETRPKAPQPAAPPPAAIGPTDEDPDQAEEARNEFQAITDGTLKLGPEEMEAYDRLVEWVKNQSFSQLSNRAKQGLRYTHLHDEADKYRGQLVALDVDVRLVNDAGKNRYGVPLQEAWGTTKESRGRLYALIVVGYPKGMPVGDAMREKAKFAGYFLKLQGYEPASAKPGQSPEKAPLLIGRLQWEPVAASPVDNTLEWRWGLPLLAIIGLVLGLRFVYHKLRPHKPPTRPTLSLSATGDAIPIDVWLEQSTFGADEEEGNNCRRDSTLGDTQ